MSDAPCHDIDAKWVAGLFGGATLQDSFATIANSVAQVSQVDRVSLLKREAGGYRMIATSTQSDVERRAKQVRLIEQMVAVIPDQAAPFVWESGTSGDPVASLEIPELEQYVISSGVTTIHLRPIAADDNPAGGKSMLPIAAIMHETFSPKAPVVRTDLQGVVDQAIRSAVIRADTPFSQLAFDAFAGSLRRTSVGARLLAALVSLQFC